jgi:hypothetical protein
MLGLSAVSYAAGLVLMFDTPAPYAPADRHASLLSGARHALRPKSRRIGGSGAPPSKTDHPTTVMNAPHCPILASGPAGGGMLPAP